MADDTSDKERFNRRDALGLLGVGAITVATAGGILAVGEAKEEAELKAAAADAEDFRKAVERKDTPAAARIAERADKSYGRFQKFIRKLTSDKGELSRQ